MAEQRNVLEEFEVALRPRLYSNLQLGKVMRRLGPQLLVAVRALKQANDMLGTREGDQVEGSVELRFSGMLHRHRNAIVRTLDRVLPGASVKRTDAGCLMEWPKRGR